MPVPARTADHTVHVHGAELSTEPASMWDYAEAIALMLAIVTFLAAAWFAASPGPDADLVVPAPIAPVSGDFEVLPGESRVVMQPQLDEGDEVAVVVRDVNFGQPITPVPEAPIDAAAAEAAAGDPLA